MKKLHSKIIAACALGVMAAAPITASAVLRPHTNTQPAYTPGGLRIKFLNPRLGTPAGTILQTRANANNGITTIYGGYTGSGAFPTIRHSGPYFKN